MRSREMSMDVKALLEKKEPFVVVTRTGDCGGLGLIPWAERRNRSAEPIWYDELTAADIVSLREAAAAQFDELVDDQPALKAALGRTISILQRPFTAVERLEARVVRLEQENHLLRRQQIAAGEQYDFYLLIPSNPSADAHILAFDRNAGSHPRSVSDPTMSFVSATNRLAQKAAMANRGSRIAATGDETMPPLYEDGGNGDRELVGAGTESGGRIGA